MPDPFAPGFLHRLPVPPRKIALLRASRIGDFICATPLFRALRASLPEAEITLIALPRMQGLAERTGWFDHFVPFPGWPGIAEQLFEAGAALRFLQAMQAEHFDLAIQMHGSGVFSNPCALLLGATYTAGFIRPGDPPGRLDAALPLSPALSEVQRVCTLARFLGLTVEDEQPSLPLWPDDFKAARRLLGSRPRPFIGLHPGADDPGKQWDKHSFARVGACLARRFGGTIVVLGAADNAALCASVAADADPGCLNLVGQTALPTAAALVAQLDLLLTNDSGPAHFAYVAKTPVVTIFLSTDPAEWAPPGHATEETIAAARYPERADPPVICLRRPSINRVAAAAAWLLEARGWRPQVP